MVGSLLFIALRTRPDILPALLILARFQKSLTAYGHLALKRVFRCLRATSKHGMIYSPGTLTLNGFVDSDYAGDTTDRKSLSGYVMTLAGPSCVCGAKQQPKVALSTCEPEYHAINLAAKEMIWAIRLLKEAGHEVDYIPDLNSDNQSAIDW